jgi:hypothetical protein
MIAEAERAFEASQAWQLREIQEGKASAFVSRASLCNSVAWCYVENSVKAKEALALARQAVSLEPENPLFVDTLGWALMRNKEYAAALSVFTQVFTNVNASEENGRRSSWRAVTLMATSQDTPATAFQAFAASLRSAVANDPVALARLNLASSLWYETQGDTNRAAAARLASGFVDERRWWVVGPFPNVDGQGLARVFGPEEQPDIDRSATFPGRLGPVHWESRRDGLPDGIVTLHELLEPLDWVAGYAWTTVESEGEQPAELRVDGDDEIRVWLEGKLVHEHRDGRAVTIDQEVVPVTLKPGSNRILVKVGNERGLWEFCVRVTGPGGRPLTAARF